MSEFPLGALALSLAAAAPEFTLDSATLTTALAGGATVPDGIDTDLAKAFQTAGGGFYGLAAGTIKISTLRQDGREAILAMLEPGNWFGEITLIDGSPRTHDATALSALDLLVVPPEAFALQMRDVVFANAIAALLAARVRGLYSMMEDATLRGLRARVARRLLGLARGDATQSAELRRSVSLPQEALAMMLGITRQTLSKELNVLAGEGIVGLGYGRIELLSLERLQQLGGAP